MTIGPALRCLERSALGALARGARPQAHPCVIGSIGSSRSGSTAASEDGHRRRLWRFGNTEAGTVSRDKVVEVSQEPTLIEDFHGATVAACGSNHSGFIVDGKLYTYGSNKYNQLGRETDGDTESGLGAEAGEVVFEASDGFRPRVLDVAFGAFHSAAITEGGALWTWGWGGSFWGGTGALGHGTREGHEEPELVQRFVEQGEEIVQVACGSQHTLVLTNEGRLYSTGKGEFGRLGRGDTHDEIDFEEIEYFSQSNDSILAPNEEAVIVKVGCGENFSACLSQAGEVWVWGRNDYGQLGLGEEAMGDMFSAERYPRLIRSLPLEGHSIVDFACGEHHIVVLTSAGALYEWGARMHLEPHPVTLPSRFANGIKGLFKVAAGDQYSMALTENGHVYSWGTQSSGCLALGQQCPKQVLEPMRMNPEVFSRQKVVDIVAQKNRVLAITHEDELASE